MIWCYYLPKGCSFLQKKKSWYNQQTPPSLNQLKFQAIAQAWFCRIHNIEKKTKLTSWIYKNSQRCKSEEK